MWNEICYEKHGSGPGHGKDKNPASKERRKRNLMRQAGRKDRAVEKSSHGVFLTVSDMMNGVRQP